MQIDVTLRASGSGTELLSMFNVKGEGQLRGVVDACRARATERTAQFAEALEKRFGGVPAAPPTREVGCASLAPSSAPFSAASPPSS